MSDNDNTLFGPPLSEADYVGALTLGSFLEEVCEFLEKHYMDQEFSHDQFASQAGRE